MKNLFGKRALLSAGLAMALGVLTMPGAGAISFSKAAKPNSPAYAFSGKTIAGGNFNGQELAGKPAVLWFWAPWCSICRGEAPDLAALAGSFKGKVKIVGVAGLGPVKDMKQFVAGTHTGGFVHLADTDGTIWGHFQIVSQPSFIFISAKGVAYREVGSLSKADLYTLTKQIIQKS